MSWDFLFGLTTSVAVLAWLALAILPRREAVLAGVMWLGVALLCAVYAATFIGLLGGLLDPVRDSAGLAPPFEYTVDGLKAVFASEGAIVLGWTHYLAFDLFVGLWIARDADGRCLARWLQLPFLFVTFLAGPIGLLAWILSRTPLTRRAAGR